MNRFNRASGCAKWSFLVFAFVTSPSIYGDGIKTCSPKEAKAAEVLSASISSWKKLRYVFHKYGHCDDGAIGEGFSESISVLMTEQWKSIDQFVRLSKKDSAFHAFVIRHLDETVPADRLQKIKFNAESNCIKSAQNVCLEIRQALDRAAQP